MNDLWLAIYQLYELLQDRVNEEAKYQAYFEDNPVVFSVLGYSSHKSFDRSSSGALPRDADLNFSPEPDFLCAKINSSELTIFELKTPFVGKLTTSRSTDGNRLKFKSIFESYISQALEYKDSIQQNQNSRDVVFSALGLSRISAYDIVLVCGLSQDNDAGDVAKLLSERNFPIRIQYFDGLLKDLLKAYSIGRSDVTNRDGTFLVLHLSLAENQGNGRAYISDFGSASNDRVSLYFQENTLVFEVIDSKSIAHALQSQVVSAGLNYVRYELSNDGGGIYLSLNVNNQEQDLRVGIAPLNIQINFSSHTLGADSKGNNGAKFKMLENYFGAKTLTFEEKLGSYHYFLSKTARSTTALEFNGKSYMVRNEYGALIQENLELRPILRDSWQY